MTEAAITLEDIIPEKPEFTIKSNGKTYSLRKINLEDQAWLKRTFGSDAAIQKIFKELDWESIARIAYRLMEDRSDFVAVTTHEINDDGEKIERRSSGPELLMRSISGLDESLNVLGAITAAIIASNPVASAALLDEVKKNLKASNPPAGGESLTDSQVSTDGPSSISER